jgi:lysine 6-dehydrogenase
MKYLVLGSGMMGRAIALDLARSAGTALVTVADLDGERARSAAERIGAGAASAALDVADRASVAALMREHDCAVGAVSYRFNAELSEAAIAVGCHYCDLGGNDQVLSRQRAMHDRAAECHTTVVPNCGLAPGLANILAARGAEEFDRIERLSLRVGGLPQRPKPPLNYQLVFSVEGLVNEYSGQAVVLRDGRITSVDAMTEVEHVRFPKPFGQLEAFHTSGGVSLLPEMFEGQIQTLDYKTLRYLGHCEQIRALMGAAGPDAAATAGSAAGREAVLEFLRNELPVEGPDVVLLRVVIEGVRADSRAVLRFESIDYSTPEMSAMMRTTAFPTSVIAQLLARGDIQRPGVWTPEQCVPLEPLLAGLGERGIKISRKLQRLGPNPVPNC